MKVHPFVRNRFIFIADLILVAACVLGSFVLRLNLGPLFMDHIGRAFVMLLVAIIIKPLVYFSFGLYRRLWIYASIQELKLITIAVTSASVLVSMVIVILWAMRIFPAFSRGVLVLDWLLSLIAVGGLRLAMRVIAENQSDHPSQNNSPTRRILIVGAGDAGALVVREMQKSTRLLAGQGGLQPICFVDDDHAKLKQEIHGIPVVGTLQEIAKIANEYRIQEVVMAIPSATGQVIRNVTELCRQKGIPFRTMPSLNELIGGKVSVSRLRDVEIADLLRREPVQVDSDLVGLTLQNRRILVTGAGGSIGRELCRQITSWRPSELILLGHGENSIFEIALELEEDNPGLPLHAVIADIRDINRLQFIFDQYRPQVVFHTAAHKHVPLMESNIEEAVTNNILGTRNITEVCNHSLVERFVMISSDKAVQPTSIMGATKRIAEMIVLDAARKSNKAFSIVRFGNVLGSRGSIVPLFKRQINRGGPVTITHPDMQRYFMTIPEAANLVLQAASMGKCGDTFALNMGEQVRIYDLAEDLIRLSGLEPGKDIEITFTGIRPGEKMKEALWDENASYEATSHPEILRLAQEEKIDSDELHGIVNELLLLAQQGESEAIIHILREIIPGSAIRSTPPPDITAIV